MLKPHSLIYLSSGCHRSGSTDLDTATAPVLNFSGTSPALFASASASFIVASVFPVGHHAVEEQVHNAIYVGSNRGGCAVKEGP
jgi:hypothetical protein